MNPAPSATLPAQSPLSPLSPLSSPPSAPDHARAGASSAPVAPRPALRPWALLREAASAWREDRCPSLGAALAYYTLFSLAPLLLVVVSVAGLVFGDEAARGQVALELRGLLGPGGAQAAEAMLAAARWPAGSVLSTLVGVATMLLGATTVLAELQDTLDHIWRAPQKPRQGLWSMVRTRLLSFGLVLGLGFLLIVSLLFAAGLAALQQHWSPWLGGWVGWADVIGQVLGFVMTTALIAAIYKWMPSVRIAWGDVWAGALVTATLLALGRHAIGLYLGHGAVGSAYGAAGSLVVVLVWVYYSSQIFLFGAELTWVMSHRGGSRRDQPVPEAGSGGGVPLRRPGLAAGA